jgi:hypothetical protein
MLYYGWNGRELYVRVNFAEKPEGVRVTLMCSNLIYRVEALDRDGFWSGTLWCGHDGVNFQQVKDATVRVSWWDFWVMALPWESLGGNAGEAWSFYVELWEKGLVVERYPERGAIEFFKPRGSYEREQWIV